MHKNADHILACLLCNFTIALFKIRILKINLFSFVSYALSKNVLRNVNGHPSNLLSQKKLINLVK